MHNKLDEYLARTDKRGAQGAGVPVLGRFGTGLSETDRRFSTRGVAGDPGSRRGFTLSRLVPGENICLVFARREKREGKFGGFGFRDTL